ncbi:response regulator transcription factor [Amycolatopsis taiwanensis]|uniref:response regulator transcription factor n=1 Tax=Amycolatopsis taiwanensis TaxID=342230 RepID=UPI00047F1F33|nr:response regulator transcription factor [Amycolatopsis taiwanensis]
MTVAKPMTQPSRQIATGAANDFSGIDNSDWLADDQPLFTGGAAMMLAAQPDTRVLWQAIDGADAIRQHVRQAPDMLLLDIQMPGTDGLAATQHLVDGGTATKIIILEHLRSRRVRADRRGGRRVRC